MCSLITSFIKQYKTNTIPGLQYCNTIPYQYLCNTEYFYPIHEYLVLISPVTYILTLLQFKLIFTVDLNENKGEIWEDKKQAGAELGHAQVQLG